MLSIELMDVFGTQIQATMFNEAAELFDDLICEKKVYIISGGSVKTAN